MAEREYRRLTRTRTRSVFGIVSTARTSLWLGKDHLLCIDMAGYAETYKRFYFRDIQAIYFRRTIEWLIVALILGAFAAMLGLLAILGGNAIVAWICGSLGGLLTLGLLLDLLAGPTCKAYLRTAVQTEDLVSVHRVRKARQILERLRPLIAAAQGQLTPNDLSPPLATEASATTGPTADDANAPPRMVS
jgi:hypothetical protein